MRVKDMMHKGVEYVAPNATLEQVAKKMRDHDVGAIPVCGSGKPMGIVTDRDVTIRALANGKDVSKLVARDVMSSNVVHCRDIEEAEDAIRIMESNQIRRLPVLDGRRSHWHGKPRRHFARFTAGSCRRSRQGRIGSSPVRFGEKESASSCSAAVLDYRLEQANV